MDVSKENNNIPYLRSLSSCLRRIVSDGYTEDFEIEDRSLASISTHKHYQPQQVNVVNHFNFEGNSDSGHNATIYVIETSDGLKGTLVGVNSAVSKLISEFMNSIVKKR